MQSTVNLLLPEPFICVYIAVAGLTGKKEGKTRLMNMVMQVTLAFLLSYSLVETSFYQLRKVTCHPYLFDGAVYISFPQTLFSP
jgi:hypothetical protein